MPLLPDFLKRFQHQIKKDSSHPPKKTIVFSRETYQVLIEDPKTHEELWVFLQLDATGHLKDTFCSCDQPGHKKGCIHQALAFLAIYGNYSLPLHLRFQSSLWNKLCLYSANGPDDFLKSHFFYDEKKRCFGVDREKKTILSIVSHTPANEEELKKILFEREDATEETSLKFSNLSSSELCAWEKGEPSIQLAYELSAWSDLAKYLLVLQESKQHYELLFEEHKNQLPTKLTINFPTISLSWVLSKKMLLEVIPSLTTVNSPLRVYYQSSMEIQEITYDEIHQRFIPIASKKPAKVKGIAIGAWVYVERDGFYTEKYHLKLMEIDLNNVQNALVNHYDTIKRLLKGTFIHETPVNISYQIFFDDDKNLHIQGYLIHPNDIIHVFGPWVYTRQGFYLVNERYFGAIDIKINSHDIPDFVTHHETWLNSQDGFNTHVTSIEASLVYDLSEQGSLSFARQLPFKKNALNENKVSFDFDPWIYIVGEGFFAKIDIQTHLPLNAITSIPDVQIPHFIRKNKQDLHLVHHFFSDICPVVKSSLTIHLINFQKIQIRPYYELLLSYQDKVLRFFGDFVHTAGEGFCELPMHLRLPERFSQEVTIESKDVSAFIQNDLNALSSKASYIDPQLKTYKGHLIVNDLDCQDDKNNRIYTLGLNYTTEIGSLSIDILWKAFKLGKRFLCSQAGLIDLSEEQFAWMREISHRQIDLHKKALLLSSIEILKLKSFNEIEVPTFEKPFHPHAWKLFHELIELKVPDEPNYTGLQSQLRPYQMIGIKWLWFLYHHGLSGLLCDDMGLGKTHQAMALLMASINERRKIDNAPKTHFLVICPTSVIYHWQEKLKTFLPDMRVWTFHGANRSLNQFYEESDLLLTSYGVWRNEIEDLSQLQFDIAIFDELQIAKNQSSRIYKTLLKAKARMRLGMTGTPIENDLRELKSLFDLILPSYFPNDQVFRKLFISPIEKEGNAARKQLLSQVIKPFILRRKKEDVLFDLPEKTEEIAHCDLSQDQRVLYENILSSSRSRLLKELEDASNPVPYVHIFALLSHLKQICDHPAVYFKTPEKYKDYSSGKWDLFIELLEEARESGQKVVVFSQYLAMLTIIENYLSERSIGFATIRGSTINRGAELERFSSDPNCQVFIASLQAAGLGVDLTAASVVIHIDRWWNAAREDQATSRVHRIGQKRGVMVFKLMTRGTLEENIDALISKKRRLMEDIISVDDAQIIKQLSREEIIALLQMR